jgi:hypothetical protein
VLYQRHTFAYAARRAPRMSARITLTPGGGVPMRVHRRG